MGFSVFVFVHFFALFPLASRRFLFMFYFLLFFSCFVTFSILEVEGAGGGGRTKDTKKIYKEYMIALARSLEKPEKKLGR